MAGRGALEKLLCGYFARYPGMRPEDMVKLLYQNEFGCGHMAESAHASLSFLKSECRALSDKAFDEPLFEDIGGGLCRLHLRPLLHSGLSLETANAMFIHTAGTKKGSVRGLEKKIGVLKALCQSGALPFDTNALDAYLTEYRALGYPPVRHSEDYRAAYEPAYRVVLADFADYAEIFKSIDSIVRQKGGACVAIDGNSGAGKSTLAALVARIYGANLFHMDDFFLPHERKTAQRLAQPGGNTDYERFLKEVLQNLERQAFCCRTYNCVKDSLGPPVRVTRRPVNVIEGVYSLHPALCHAYDLRVFMAISKPRQRQRLLRRSGPALYRRFAEEWIPQEERYFEAFFVREGCHLVYETGLKGQKAALQAKKPAESGRRGMEHTAGPSSAGGAPDAPLIRV